MLPLWLGIQPVTNTREHQWLQAGGEGATGPACTSCGHPLSAGEAQQQVATEGRCANCQGLKEAGYFCSVCGKVRRLVSPLLNEQQHQAGMLQGYAADIRSPVMPPCSQASASQPSAALPGFGCLGYCKLYLGATYIVC